ncbi:MAG TPA: two-component regulator propeller domain-containing protein, partial [Gemmatimonadaceae bacterium]|nr:two-component regulator propeller domain-containing protein [Gemmatimonadaceae bacterium]
TSGALWAGTEGSGLVRHAGGRFRRFSTRDGLYSDRIGALHAGPSGRLWVGAIGGVSVLAGDRFQRLPASPWLRDERITALAEDGDGGLWIGSGARGLYHFADGTYRRLGLRDGLTDERVTALHVARDGALFVGSYGVGVTRIQGTTASRVGAQGPDAPRRVNEFLEDPDGVIWLGADNGLFRLEGAGAVAVTRPDGRPFHQVEALRVDAEGNLWVGTRPSGLFRLRRASVGTVGRAQGLPHEVTYAVTGDGAGGAWIGTLGGLLHLGTDARTVYSVRSGALRDDVVRDVIRDSAGVVWAATNGGLTRIARGRATTYTVRDGLPDDRVRVLLPSRDGSLWIGTMNGLARLRDGRITTVDAGRGLRDPYVLSLHEGRDGTLWVGTQTEGLFRLVDGRFVPGPAPLARQPVFRMHEDDRGALWIGTTHGLVRVHGDSVTRIGMREGLPGDVVFQAIDDGEGSVWLTGTWGIGRVSLESLHAVVAGRRRVVQVKTFGAGDGMAVREASALSRSWRAPDGALWFATPAGVARVAPGELRQNRRPPPVHVERVVANDDTIEVGPAPLALSAGTRTLELHYTALGLVAPGSLRFRYRLEGWDESWVEDVARRTAFYTNLPPGDYRFRVDARNEDGVWNSIGASLAFRIEPHVWQTDWFRALVGLALVALVGVAVRLRMRRVRRAVEAVERERARTRVVSILESISDGFVAIDGDWRFTYVNHTAEALLGVPRAQMLGRVCWDVVPERVATAVRAPLLGVAERRAPRVLDALWIEQSGRWIEMHAFPAEEGISIYFADVTARVDAEEALRGLSLRDDLTGLYNRRGLVALAEQQVRLAERSREGFDVVFIDMDGLKQINDSLGHPAGDQALLDTAEILRATFRDSDVLARLGGDEFAAIVLGDSTAVGGASVRLREAVDRHNATAERPYRLSLSVGHSRFDPAAPVPIEDLLRLADRRMYEEKRLKGTLR